MAEEETIELTRADGVATISIERPEKKNALTFEMFRRLHELFEDVAHTDSDRVLILTGRSGDFCSGADLTGVDTGQITSFGPIGGARWMREISRAAASLNALAKPTVAAVNGVAAGAGCNLALGCDIVFATESARFSEIFVKRGLNMDFGGTWLLPRLLGAQKAKDFAFRGELISAKEACDLGLVLEVVPEDDLERRVGEYARELASLPPVPLMLMKNGLNQALGWTMEQALEYEATAQVLCFGTEDLQEAMLAWVQKREGTYKGR